MLALLTSKLPGWRARKIGSSWGPALCQRLPDAVWVAFAPGCTRASFTVVESCIVALARAHPRSASLVALVPRVDDSSCGRCTCCVPDLAGSLLHTWPYGRHAPKRWTDVRCLLGGSTTPSPLSARSPRCTREAPSGLRLERGPHTECHGAETLRELIAAEFRLKVTGILVHRRFAQSARPRIRMPGIGGRLVVVCPGIWASGVS